MRILGLHAIEERLRAGGVSGELLIAKRGARIDRLAELARRRGVTVRRVSPDALDRLAANTQNRGVVLHVEGGARPTRGALYPLLGSAAAPDSLVLVLDGITDPQNLGTLLRSADQFAVDFVVLPVRRAARETDLVERVSSGASSWVKSTVETNLPAAIVRLKEAGFWVYGADMGGSPAHRLDLNGRVVLVMGSEGRGLGRLVRERCDGLVSIPAAGHVDSFNVSVAAGILLYEIRRQQGFFESS